jgi:NIMA (never in mitosis gene a)-related kinase
VLPTRNFLKGGGWLGALVSTNTQQAKRARLLETNGQVVKVHSTAKARKHAKMADQYRAMQVIGKGSYGVVRLLQRKTDKKLYVMKMVECKQESQDDALKEVNLLAKLNHPNIVGFVENFFSSKGELCIVMEYCDSGDLDGYITELKKSKRQMSEDACLDYFVQISMALQYLHEHHILHRDLKPANVFLSNQVLVCACVTASQLLLPHLP